MRTYGTKTCADCGAEFTMTAPTALRCPPCRNAHKKVYKKAYRQTPEGKAQEKAYRQTPERKAHEKARQQTPKFKAYRQSPEYKAIKRAYMRSIDRAKRVFAWLAVAGEMAK